MIVNQTRHRDIATPGQTAVPKGFRRLKWSEVVVRGDYVVDELRGFQLWAGPGGFRADTYLKPIYRRGKVHPARPEPA